ncbi:receptor-transporting protein 3-like [Melanotaenia boesemani]|uniref:receptor-transporting protein 3-like n=1 Tax=Melanotaenia boesemani TaxID=1250792 RepID=UPI001C046F65|nr:receptor-transporting protein 3-like [Melanotaenia boesemani]
MESSKWTNIFQNKAKQLKHSWNLEFDEHIVPNRPHFGWRQCVNNTCARFRCSSCGRGWSSNRVMVLFHMRLMNGNGIVKMRPLYQKCKNCSDAPMEKPNIESDSIAVLMDNLMEKIRENCYHENTGGKKRHFRSYDGNNPHQPDHCQGCKLGLCRKK